MTDSSDYPNDADGDALRRVAGDGSDMSRPMEIDFTITAPDEEAGQQIARAAEREGYRAKVHQYTKSGEWACYCTKTMVANHRNVVVAQLELDEIANPFGGNCDGWGTSGNVQAV